MKTNWNKSWKNIPHLPIAELLMVFFCPFFHPPKCITLQIQMSCLLDERVCSLVACCIYWYTVASLACCVGTGCHWPCVSIVRQVRYEDEDEDEGPQPDPTLEQGAPIPIRLQSSFAPELSSTPLEDIDSFYHNQRVCFTSTCISI